MLLFTSSVFVFALVIWFSKTSDCAVFPILFHNQRAVVLWTLAPAERDAFLANESTKLLTKNYWILLEIATTRSSHDLHQVKLAYHARYKKSLEEDVAYHTSGDVRKVKP